MSLQKRKARPRTWPTVLDMFCGCGGVTEGLRKRNFRIVAAIDNDPDCCETYRSNHPSVALYQRDIESVSPREIKDRHFCERNLDLLVVCAPCQPFSSQNRRPEADPRSRLLLNAVKFARELKPAAILFENVPGLTQTAYAPLLEELSAGLKRIGYVLGEPQALNAADFGVPQRRIRCLMLATRDRDIPAIPTGTMGVSSTRNVWDAIGDLSSLEAGQSDAIDSLHRARNHHPLTLERLARIPKDGGSRSDLPSELHLKCHTSAKSYPDVYGRMSWKDVSPTLTTGCTDITKGRYGHPLDNRSITLREAARLQTFADGYKFHGGYNAISRQIGNAVPVEMIAELSPFLRDVVFKY